MRHKPAVHYQMADLELRGRARERPSLEVSGKLNPLAKPLALDIQGRMRDLELLPPGRPASSTQGTALSAAS